MRDVDRGAGVRRLDRQLASAAIHEDGELDALGASEIEQLVDGRADAAPRIQDVVDEDDRRAVDVERKRRTARVGLQAGRRVIVAVIRDVDEAHGMPTGQPLREALGDPGTARINSDERGIGRNGALHALDELREGRLGVRKIVRRRHARRRTMPAG